MAEISNELIYEVLKSVQARVAQVDGKVDELAKHLKSQRGIDRFHPYLLRDDISRDQLALLETHQFELPGVDVHPDGVARGAEHLNLGDAADH